MTINFTHDKNSISCYAFKLIYLFIFSEVQTFIFKPSGYFGRGN